ncbi:MAG TPA: hypothetical protein ENI85_16850 [Deltaproteobacteria bacterium]|nr:hypothetical protein [Deltaproteobacteria bacterium]
MFEKAESGSAWYHHFWVWFIIALLGFSVVGSLGTVAIAYRHRDVDVRTLERPHAADAGPAGVLPGPPAGTSRADGS